MEMTSYKKAGHCSRWDGLNHLLSGMMEAMKSYLITEQSIGRTLIRLAIPAVLSNLFYMVFEVADMFWVGRLGGEAVAALSSASFFIWMLRALGLTIATGALAIISQKVGAHLGKIPKQTIRSARISALIFGLLITGPALFFSHLIFTWMNLSDSLAGLASGYSSIFSLGLVFVVTMQNTEHIIRGMGNTHTPMLVTGIALALNIALDPLFMFTFNMGLNGAALATILSQTIGALLMEYARYRLSRKLPDSEIRRHHFRVLEMRQLMRIGAPMAFSTAMFSLIYLLLAAIIARFGEAPLAAIGIGHRIEAIPYFVTMGFAMAAATLVGQNLGARRLDRAKKSALACLLIASGLMLIFSLLMILYAEPLYKLFIADSIIIRHGGSYLRIVALFELFLAFELIFEGAFSGAGDTQGPMWLVFGGTFLRLPIAYLFAVHWDMGVIAVWWSIALTTALKGSALAVLFKLRAHKWALISEQELQAEAQKNTLVMTVNH